jgi:hypothetical protein
VRRSIKYALLIILVLPALSTAQSNVTGLGKYVIGITTPDSLAPTEFAEEEQSYVKGTIALPCSHIRTFTSALVTIADVAVANVVLVFYDDTLFKISCDYSAPLKAAFVKQHGPGIARPMSRFQFCTTEKHTPLSLWGESWPGVDRLTLVVHRKGYTADCKWEEGARLTIVSQSILALTSDCDLKPADLFVDEFSKVQLDSQGKQR